MSTAVPEFNNVAEYARYGWVLPGALQKRVAPFYSGAMEIIVADEVENLGKVLSNYGTRVRGFLYQHGFRPVPPDGKSLKAHHIVSATALKRLADFGGNVEAVRKFYTVVAKMMNHDILHGFNGLPENFTEFDEQLIFGGIEFFPVMSHAEICEKWLKRDTNGDFLVSVGRGYVEGLAPLVLEYMRSHDPETLKLIDYFVLIYQKCLLTFLWLKHEAVGDFNQKAQNTLYAEAPHCEITRAKCDTLLNHGLEKGTIKNNYTLLLKLWYDRRWTGAARAAIKMMDDLFGKEAEAKEVSRVEALTTENLIIGWWFRMVPNMQRLPNLQKRFQKMYTK